MLQHFDTVTSTMDVARENLISRRLRFDQTGRLRYDGVIAAEQTAGRGQRERTWYAPYGESLCATFYFRRGLVAPQTAGQIALLAGVAAADALHRICLERTGLPSSRHCPPIPNVGLKWPNDIFLNGKKAGGILVEMVRVPEAGWVALIGVGMNVQVRAFPPEFATTATSLCLAGLHDVSPVQLGERIAGALDRLADARRNAGFDAILRRWHAYDQTPGRRYQTEIEGAVVTGTAEGIDPTGALQLRLDDGSLFITTSASSLTELNLVTTRAAGR